MVRNRKKKSKKVVLASDHAGFKLKEEIKEFLIKKINNSTPQCISEGKDVYKRTLAECFVNGESLSKFLVRGGYAFAYRKYSKKFIEDEEFAKANKLGMWPMTLMMARFCC